MGAAVARKTTATGLSLVRCAQGLSVRIAWIWASVHASGGLVSQKGCARKQEEHRQKRVHNHNMTAIRRGGVEDLDAVAAIQQASPGAARWKAADYLEQDFWVAMWKIASWDSWSRAPWRRTSARFSTSPWHRISAGKGWPGRCSPARLTAFRGSVFLEVRESNRVAQEFYKSLGFQHLNKRNGYYDSPPETAIVMKFHSC